VADCLRDNERGSASSCLVEFSFNHKGVLQNHALGAESEVIFYR